MIVAAVLVVFGGLTPVGIHIYVEDVNRVECIMNIRKVHQHMRGYHHTKEMETGHPLDVSFLNEYGPLPVCPSGGTYTYLDQVPKSGVPYCTCSHAKTKGHVPDNYGE